MLFFPCCFSDFLSCQGRQVFLVGIRPQNLTPEEVSEEGSCRQSSGTHPENRDSVLSTSRASAPPWCPETGSNGRRQTWCRAQAEADVLRKHPHGVRTLLVTLPDTA